LRLNRHSAECSTPDRCSKRVRSRTCFLVIICCCVVFKRQKPIGYPPIRRFATILRVTLAHDDVSRQVLTVLRHKKHPPAGKKSQLRLNRIWIDQADALEIKEGEEVTLMDWGNTIIRRIYKDASGAVTGIDADLHLAGDFKTTKWKLTWLAAVSSPRVHFLVSSPRSFSHFLLILG